MVRPPPRVILVELAAGPKRLDLGVTLLAGVQDCQLSFIDGSGTLGVRLQCSGCGVPWLNWGRAASSNM
jgi:hypothetical protein